MAAKQTQRIRNFAALLLLVVVVFGAYFFLYTDQKEDQITRHRLRLLSSAGRYASDALEGLRDNVSRAVRIAPSYSSKATLDEVVGKLGQISGIETGKSGSLSDDDLKKAMDSPGFRFEEYEVKGTKRKVTTGMALDYANADPRVAFVLHRDNLVFPRYSVNLRELLAPTLPSELFDGVLIARENGDVLFQAGRGDVAIERLGLPPEKKEDGTTAAPAMSETQVLDVTLAGEKQKLFIQPIKLPVPINVKTGVKDHPWKQEEYWVVAGYMSTGRFRGMAMAISPTVVLATIGLIALGLLCLPFLKVRYMGAREELRHADFVALVVTSIVAASLVTFGWLFYVGQRDQISRLEGDLCTLSSDIGRKLHSEIEDLDESLVAITVARGETARATVCEKRAKVRASNTKLRTAILSGAYAEAMKPYPFLEMAFWMKSDGTQTSKWTVRDNTTALGKFDTRGYFQAAMNEEMWPGSNEHDNFTAGRFVESIRSLTTGDEYAVLTRRLKKPTSFKGGSRSDSNVVAAIESRLLSVISPGLPPGYGFAIIDASGLVQFHSDRIRNVRENFFDELDLSRATRAAVASGQCALVNVSYRTIPSKLLVSPIEGTPWTLIVFTGLSDTRIWMTETLTLAIAVFGAYLILLLLSALALHLLPVSKARPGEAYRAWYWPNDGGLARYALLATVNLVLIGVGAAVILGGNTVATAVACGVLPLIALLALHGVLRVSILESGRTPGTGWGIAPFAFMVVTLVAVTGVLPAVGFFDAVYREQGVLQVKEDQIEFMGALRARREDLRAWYRNVDLECAPEEIRGAIEGAVRADADSVGLLGMYAPRGWTWGYSLADTARMGDESRQPVVGWISRGMHRLGLPTRVSLRSLRGEQRADSTVDSTQWDRYRWREEADSVGLYLSADSFMPVGVVGKSTPRTPPQFEVDPIVVRSELEEAPLAARRGFWGLAAIGLLALIWLVRSSLRHLFLVGFHEPKSVDGEEVLADAWGAGLAPVNHAILLRSRVDKIDENAGSSYLTINNQKIRSAFSIDSLVECARKSERPGIRLTAFDRGLKEPFMIERKLELVERLNLIPGKRVVIESSVDPMYFLTERFKDHYEERATVGISLERWSAALQPYARLRTPLEKKAAEFKSWFADRKPSKVESRSEEDAHVTPLDVREEAYRALLDEGEPDTRLQEFAKGLASHKDTKDFTAEDVVDNILDLSQAHYRKIWSSCSTDEKTLLYRIAKEGFACRLAVNTLRPLIRRGLVRMDPNCRIMNESFRRFVLSAERPEVFDKWETAAGPSVWARLRTPILVSVIALAAFFFATQRQTFNQALGILAALTASAPALIRLIGALSIARQGDAPKTSG